LPWKRYLLTCWVGSLSNPLQACVLVYVSGLLPCKDAVTEGCSSIAIKSLRQASAYKLCCTQLLFGLLFCDAPVITALPIECFFSLTRYVLRYIARVFTGGQPPLMNVFLGFSAGGSVFHSRRLPATYFDRGFVFDDFTAEL